MFNYLSRREQIIEFLISSQPFLKQEMEELKGMKEMYLHTLHNVFKEDMEAQFDARIKQAIAFHVSDALAIPAEFCIIELEKIDLEQYLNV